MVPCFIGLRDPLEQVLIPPGYLKGRKLPGHYGNAQITVRNLEIVDIKTEQNLLLVKGSVPGGKRGIIMVKKLK